VQLLPSALFWGKHCVHSESQEGDGIGVGKAVALLELPQKPLSYANSEGAKNSLGESVGSW